MEQRFVEAQVQCQSRPAANNTKRCLQSHANSREQLWDALSGITVQTFLIRNNALSWSQEKDDGSLRKRKMRIGAYYYAMIIRVNGADEFVFKTREHKLKKVKCEVLFPNEFGSTQDQISDAL